MKSDPIAPFRDLLKDAENGQPASRLSDYEAGRHPVDIVASGNYTPGGRPPGNFGGGGGGQSGGGAFSGGMDPWQTSVENRLTGLETRISRIETNTGTISADLATLTERVSHLPRKGALYTTAVAIVVAIGAFITFGQKLQSLVSTSPTTSSAVSRSAGE